ncbi:hypothetical protein BTO02_02610 [Paraburkholderia sp. SOS3]|nr:hypothetical protein BTO02_02610 [Paraburkholderia sp. SOS3]
MTQSFLQTKRLVRRGSLRRATASDATGRAAMPGVGFVRVRRTTRHAILDLQAPHRHYKTSIRR